jgi:hypothetical protein
MGQRLENQAMKNDGHEIASSRSMLTLKEWRGLLAKTMGKVSCGKMGVAERVRLSALE